MHGIMINMKGDCVVQMHWWQSMLFQTKSILLCVLESVYQVLRTLFPDLVKLLQRDNLNVYQRLMMMTLCIKFSFPNNKVDEKQNIQIL